MPGDGSNTPPAWGAAGLSVGENQEVFGVSRASAQRGHVAALRRAARAVPVAGKAAQPGPAPRPSTPVPVAAPAAAGDALAHDAVDALQGIVAARRSHSPPPPAVHAGYIRAIGKAPRDLLDAAWKDAGARQPPTQPRRRAAWLKACGPGQAVDEWLEMCEAWKELQAWHASASIYASAVALWGEAAELSGSPPWPPTEAALRRFAWCCESPTTLTKYLQRLRSVVALLRCDAGALSDARRLERGAAASKKGALAAPRMRATAQQTRDICRALREQLGAHELADAFVVTRHFCLRFGSETAPLTQLGAHSGIALRCATESKPARAEITFFNRKMCNTPVVVTRVCACSQGAGGLCGVCVLHRRCSKGRVFPNVSYSAALQLLKRAAAIAGLPNPTAWGTHCFRRGAADDALRAGGPSALFWSGGWRGVAAFAYASARALGEMNAARFLTEYSDSSDDERPDGALRA